MMYLGGSTLNPWMLEAACRDADPDIFFPDNIGTPTPAMKRQTEMALDICSRCPVVTECLDFANETKTFDGIFGGKTEKERKAAYAADQTRRTRSN